MEMEVADASVASGVSAASDLEGRVHHLAEELRSKRGEVAILKDEQKKRKHERLLVKETSLMKQIEVFRFFSLVILKISYFLKCLEV